jgi:hypothetical protein
MLVIELEIFANAPSFKFQQKRDIMTTDEAYQYS